MTKFSLVYSVTISKFPTAGDFPIEIKGFKTDSLFDTGVQVSCISYDCCKEITSKARINTNSKAEVSSDDRSNFAPMGLVIC